MVKSNQMLNEYNHWNPRRTVLVVDTFAFYQITTNIVKTDKINDDWKKNATFHECDKRGHIIPNVITW